MSSLVTNPTSQFINPFFGNPCENAKIFVGKVNTDAAVPENRQQVYLMQWTDEATLNKVPLPQPLVTNSAGVIVYQGLPVTPWVDGAYSITIVGYDGAQLYTSFYVDDPTYWLRLDLATEPKKTADGLHYDPEDHHGVNLVAGAADILSPEFEGVPTAPTPPAGDSSTRIATTEFVQAALSAALSVGIVGTCCWWADSTPPVGAVALNGSSLLKEDYPEAYAIVKDTYATQNGLVPDSAYFIVPDCRSRYIRGFDYGAGLSSYADFMKKYNDMFKQHDHDIYTRGPTDVSTGGGALNDMIPMTGAGGGMTTSMEGGAETMPKTLVMLPIMWVTPPESVAVASWHMQERYSSGRPAVHHYNADTGELLTSSLAHPSPLTPGEWLTPENATQISPIPSRQNHCLVFRDGAWQHDAELFREKQEQRNAEHHAREQQNRALMEKEQRRTQANAWLKAQGAPFTLDDI